MDPHLKYFLVMPVSLTWALVSIHGGRKGWKCLVDPPVWLKSLSSHPLLKAVFGTHVMKNVTVATGWISLAIAFYVMYCL